MKNILVTGGLGYIGSHTVVKLIEAGYNPIIVDNMRNSSLKVLNSIEKITGVKPKFIYGDIREDKTLSDIFHGNRIDAVIHFAAYKSVKESVDKPMDYMENNVGGTISVLKWMKSQGVKNFVFSSSCTVYGEPDSYPVTEDMPHKKTSSPYGETKKICEQILETNSDWLNTVSLRYFNPLGAHPSGLLFEKIGKTPEFLIPYIFTVLDGTNPFLRVFGSDYNTVDGTAVRDYLDINDLADAHVKALGIVEDKPYEVINLGTGKGVSVLQVIEAYKRAGVTVPYELCDRRQGDVEAIYGDITKAKEVLGWEPTTNLDESIKSLLGVK